MQDSVTIKLPVSGSDVEIRNYTTRADDEKADEVLYAGVQANQFADSKGNEKANVTFPFSNVMARKHVYINRLVKAIDGENTNIALKLKELRSEDYLAIEEKVDEIMEKHSPKVKEDKSASPKNTSEK